MTAIMDRPRHAVGTGSEFRRWNDPVDTTWHRHAACYGATELEQRLFDPVGLEEAKEDAWRRAAYGVETFCQFCPVADLCRTEGEQHRYEGVWGGEFRERRGVIDLDTGMVLRADDELEVVAGGPREPPHRPPTEPPPEPVFPTVLDRRGQEQFALLAI